jgi:hypothetical protein
MHVGRVMEVLSVETAYFEDDIYKASGRIHFLFEDHITQPQVLFTYGQLLNEK